MQRLFYKDEIVETNMDDIEIQIVLDYYIKNIIKKLVLFICVLPMLGSRSQIEGGYTK